MRNDNVVKHKALEFAKRIVRLYKYLTEERKEFVLSKQVLRSGTSIGANIAESECAISKKDFLAKLYIAYKECAETSYWLELLFSSDYIDTTQYTSIKADCDELLKILSAITKTTREGIRN